jgi:hypothetical protein
MITGSITAEKLIRNKHNFIIKADHGKPSLTEKIE